MSTEDQPGTPTPPVGDQQHAGYQGPQYVAGDTAPGEPHSGPAQQGSWSNHPERGAGGANQPQPGAWGASQPAPGGWGGADQDAGAGSSVGPASASHGGPAFPAPAGVALLDPQAATRTRTGPRARLGALLVAAAVSAVVGAGAGIGSYAYLAEEGRSAAPITVTTQPARQAPVLDGTVAAAAGRIQPSVVTIGVQGGQGGGVGSGVVLDADGHILTNDHVVSGPAEGERPGGQSRLTVTFFDGTTASARLVGTSGTNDLAVIKVDGVDNLKPATFASSAAVTVGQAVVAAGAPLGLSQSVTSGIVSNTARPVRSGDNDDAVYLAVQTDAAINPGNSGGPLVDLNGSVLGINSSIASTGSGSQAGNIGIGFAIPADVAVRVAGELIANGASANAALGVTVGGSDSAVSAATGVPLQSVAPGSAADQAGLQQGDVVTRLNDFPTTTPDGLIAATRFYAPGTEVKVTYTRDGGAPQTVDVTLGRQ